MYNKGVETEYKKEKLERCIYGKVCYCKKGAQTAKNKAEKDRGQPLRIYQCDCGDHWHLTHVDPYRREKNTNELLYKGK